MAQKTPNNMLKTTDANAPAENHTDSKHKRAIAKNRITVQHAKAQKITENYQFAFHSFQHNTANPHPKTTFKTLIAEDAILILAKLASKTIQQSMICHSKRRCSSAPTRMQE